ncbi:adenosylmethionine decarboxylase [Roseomonas gilardii]|uniref:S-adenosylmethionine decarboxylase proenzyme n=1 Tax=Roseomonas gilardii TaxID=257708 RepID=A0A1L7AGQ2_9PROT|nr:adenosylmethionine decarboxylase [Roseomonas gilardii]APT57879.1 S-adenosylmethionine decarboxylase proenzyme [Roseomonas gilardii]MDT8331458.1 adenosylmethionine decarboxylase [Roseomonas gilardii]PZR16987.1 MAG: adenosylmethionine decarboxylase [Azospirillum brasilense]SUE43368.1 S-adenosylmethionine decarboxylase proenzyme precursor [Roseomonas gilardii subsp. rosea]
MDALTAPLGMVSEFPSDAQGNFSSGADEAKDYFVEKDGVRFAGTHLIIDLWGATNLDDPAHIDDVLREAAIATGATILHGHFHHFQPNGGVSGVLVLAESHVSIHTWPEKAFGALDIFVCGVCDPYKAIPVLKKGFLPERVQLGEHRRGISV